MPLYKVTVKQSTVNNMEDKYGNDYMDEWNFENWGVKYWSKTQEFMDYMEKAANGKK